MFPETILSAGKALLRLKEAEKLYGKEFAEKYGKRYIEIYQAGILEQMAFAKSEGLLP